MTNRRDVWGRVFIGALCLGVVALIVALRGFGGEGDPERAGAGGAEVAERPSDAQRAADDAGAEASGSRVPAEEIAVGGEEAAENAAEPELDFVWIELRPVDQQGRPVDLERLGTDAFVNVWNEFEPGKWYQYERRRVVDRTGLVVSSVALGEYRFELRAGDGFHGGVGGRPPGEVRAGDVFGTALSELIRLDEPGVREAPREVEMVFRGDGVLRLRVVDAAGQPVAVVSLVALAEGAPFDGGSGQLPDMRSMELALANAGLGRVRGTTDSSGRLELAGLRAGAFFVHHATADGAKLHDRIHEGALAADGSEHLLVLDGGGLLVEVLDTSGARVAAPAVWNHMSSAAPPPALGSSVRVWLEPVLGPPPGAAFSLDGVVTEDGRVRFAGLPSGDYRVVAASRTQGPAVALARVDVLGGVEDLTLRLPPKAQAATLTVNFVDSDGDAPMGFTRVALSDRATGRRVASSMVDSLFGPARATFVVRPGAYWVDVESLPTNDGPQGSVDTRGVGSARAAVSLAPGAAESMKLRLPEPARLEVSLSSASVAAVDAEDPAPGASLESEGAPLRARIELHRQGAAASGLGLGGEAVSGEAPVIATFYEAGERPAVLEAIDASRLWLSEPLPAGAFRVVAVAADGRRAEAFVELIDGRTSSVALTFE